ncbi:MAG TPA: stalk domain-containing protein [Clostridia bacterium]|nr:stalk domain-containing protein [Clostridia bacterium]
MMKKFLSVFLVMVILISGISYAGVSSEYVEALTNSINIVLNGEIVEGNNLLYEGTTYVPLRIMSEMIGGVVSWEGETRTASIALNRSDLSEENSNEGISLRVESLCNPIIGYGELGVDKSEIFGVTLDAKEGAVDYSLEADGMHWNTTLNLETEYEMILVKNDGSTIKYSLNTGGLPTIKQSADMQIVYVPAMPDKGFNFPYMIRVPGTVKGYREYNGINYDTAKQYLIFDSTNVSGQDPLDYVTETLTEDSQEAASVAADFGYPIVMPIIPRTSISVKQDGFGYSFLYEHSLDRDSLYVKELVTTDSHRQSNLYNYAEAGYDPEKFYDFDEQIVAMIDHAVSYLNEQGMGVEEKVIGIGYSATGAFVDHMSYLHPEKFEMAFCGGSNDNVVLPTDTYKGETISFPLGNADYSAITGKTFSLSAYNETKRVYFMGKQDTNNTVDYLDCYFEYTNEQVKRIFGTPVLPRAYEVAKTYGEEGGKGIFILMDGEEHTISNAMRYYIRKFISINADSDTTVYLEPTEPCLETTIFE